MIDSRLRSLIPYALTLALLFGAIDAGAVMKQGKRFGIEGQVVGYDETKKTMTIKVTATEVKARIGGNTVGGKAPADVPRLKDFTFAIEPEGSVLRRTVVKGIDGGGLDKEGTKEGFKKAIGLIPTDRSVVMSCEKNDPAAVAKGAPKYKILLIQIQLTEEELQKIWDERSVEE